MFKSVVEDSDGAIPFHGGETMPVEICADLIAAKTYLSLRGRPAIIFIESPRNDNGAAISEHRGHLLEVRKIAFLKTDSQCGTARRRASYIAVSQKESEPISTSLVMYLREKTAIKTINRNWPHEPVRPKNTAYGGTSHREKLCELPDGGPTFLL